VLSPEIIRSLQKLWVALPVRAPNDGVSDPGERQRAILETYCEALEDCSAEAVAATVKLLIAGKIDDASKSFCPKPPELATYVREQHRKINAERRARALPEPAYEHGPEHRAKMRHAFTMLSRSLQGDPEAKRYIEEKRWRS
jgi:hypothetical protein